jgi:hypothetical protein
MSRRGSVEEKTIKSDPIYRNRLVNMLVNRILKHGQKSLAYQIIYRAMKKIQQKTEKNRLYVFVSYSANPIFLKHIETYDEYYHMPGLVSLVIMAGSHDLLAE